jgi:hypothetical protein
VSLLVGWRSIPLLLRDYAAQWIRRCPALSERIGRALGRPAPRERSPIGGGILARECRSFRISHSGQP